MYVRHNISDAPKPHVYTQETQALLDILYDRVHLLSEMGHLVSRMRRIQAKYGYEPPGDDSTYSEFLAYSDDLRMDANDRFRMDMFAQLVRSTSECIVKLENAIPKDAFENEDARLILSIPGFEPFGALTIALSIDGIERFANHRKLNSFLGFRPRVSRSDTGLSIDHPKYTNHTLTRIVVFAAMAGVRKDPELAARFEAKCVDHGRPAAYRNVAARMARHMWNVLNVREPYRSKTA